MSGSREDFHVEFDSFVVYNAGIYNCEETKRFGRCPPTSDAGSLSRLGRWQGLAGYTSVSYAEMAFFHCLIHVLLIGQYERREHYVWYRSLLNVREWRSLNRHTAHLILTYYYLVCERRN